MNQSHSQGFVQIFTHTQFDTGAVWTLKKEYIYHSLYTSEFIFDICNLGNGPGSQQRDLGGNVFLQWKKENVCIGLTDR